MECGIDEDQMNLPRPHGTPGLKKKLIADLRVKQPDSSIIQLGISCFSLTMIWLKNEAFVVKIRKYFKFYKEVVEHHLSF